MISRDAEPVLALGLMSGTSADGVDAALVMTDGESRIEFLDATTVPYDASLRRGLIHAAQAETPLMNVLLLEKRLTQVHACACEALLAQANLDVAEVQLVGFHGHTIRHDAARGITWQLGDAALLAAKLRLRVVHDFRRADIAQGGQGAPLAPLFHQELLQAVDKPAVVLNLGGVANLTWLGSRGDILAGDTGPGCGLLDAWMEQRTGKAFDEDGKVAAVGQVDHERVRAVLLHDSFQRPLPKSADRYEFDFIDLNALSTEDGAATLCAITAEAVAGATVRLPERPKRCWVTGGGSKHPILMQMLNERLGHAEPIETLGLSAEFMEAQCFAWLAVRRRRGLATSLPQTTGCHSPTCGGAMTDPPMV